MSLSEARQALLGAASAYAQAVDEASAKALFAAAIRYHQARMATASGAAAAAGQQAAAVMPFGRARGRPLSEVSTRDVEWALGVVEASIEDASKARWRDSNLRLLGELRAELGRRARR